MMNTVMFDLAVLHQSAQVRVLTSECLALALHVGHIAA
jgi:hypothetical protein